MCGVALGRADELLREYPLRAKAAFAEGEGDLVVDLAEKLTRPLYRRGPSEAVAGAEVVSRNDDDLLAREASERAIGQRRDLRVRIRAARACGNEGEAGSERESRQRVSGAVEGN